ncbi:hypothetical protein CBP36_20100 (plasmid) [Acidovorax carolinensis]|uniref:Uncharacterized protein n=1 Tax=Acidovorax carolinensis TaxID=553814 RepID=A0A240UIE9_9BURK|nr:hypothetical protein CBP35_20080 [Acidovorax carolinensis]ART61271.1 hypothetical protein CBP36_20100 [Acidovorax carolinensis]
MTRCPWRAVGTQHLVEARARICSCSTRHHFGGGETIELQAIMSTRPDYPGAGQKTQRGSMAAGHGGAPRERS